MALIVDGTLRIAPGLIVKNYEETGLRIEPGPGRAYSRLGKPIEKILLHWTAGEGDEKRIFKTLEDRGVGTHLFVRKDGVVFQFVDLMLATVHGSPTKTSIGIEIQNAGLPIDNEDFGRERYEDVIKGRRIELLKFTPAQDRAVQQLCKILSNLFSIPYVVPVDSNGGLIKEKLSLSQISSFKGIMGHFHTSRKGKLDPGTDILLKIQNESAALGVQNEPISEAGVVPAPVPEIQSTSTPVVEPDPEILERFERLTQGRAEAPTGVKYTYFIASGSTADDPHISTNQILSDEQVEGSIFNVHEEFFNQINDIKSATTLQLNAAVPVIEVFTIDPDLGGFISLNEMIFGKSPFHNIFESAGDFKNIQNLERPIASIINFRVDVRPPTQGGSLSINTANLEIKVHNTDLVSPNDPLGKYISWMLKPGWGLKIRYGLQGSLEGRNILGIHVNEEDYIIASYDLTMNNDLTMDIRFVLSPAWTKLSSQVSVGQSIPVEEIGEITNQDIQLSTGGNVDPTVLRQLSTFQKTFNSTVKQLGSGVQVSGSTLSLIMQGAFNNLEISKDPNSISPIQVENLIEALKSIQSSLLTRKFERLIRKVAYKTEVKGIKFVACNMGAIYGELLLSEIDALVNILGKRDPTTDQNRKKRNKFRLVFGNFNSKAGRFANKPISSFPINLDQLFAYIRTKREVGKFSDTLNNFIERINSLAQDRAFYISDVETAGDNESFLSLEIPQLKYSFYEDPQDEESWVFYVFDNKEYIVNTRIATTAIARGKRDLIKQDIISISRQNRIPWIELGSRESFIRQITINSKPDDEVLAHQLIEANAGFNTRQMDNQKLLKGIDRNFLASLQGQNSTLAVKDSLSLLPVRVQMDSYFLGRAAHFGSLYMFFPIDIFSAYYQIYEISHEINKNGAHTQFTLQLNITGRNTNLSS